MAAADCTSVKQTWTDITLGLSDGGNSQNQFSSFQETRPGCSFSRRSTSAIVYSRVKGCRHGSSWKTSHFQQIISKSGFLFSQHKLTCFHKKKTWMMCELMLMAARIIIGCTGIWLLQVCIHSQRLRSWDLDTGAYSRLWLNSLRFLLVSSPWLSLQVFLCAHLWSQVIWFWSMASMWHLTDHSQLAIRLQSV